MSVAEIILTSMIRQIGPRKAYIRPPSKDNQQLSAQINKRIYTRIKSVTRSYVKLYIESDSKLCIHLQVFVSVSFGFRYTKRYPHDNYRES